MRSGLHLPQPAAFYRTIGICLAAASAMSCQSNEVVRQDKLRANSSQPMASTSDTGEDMSEDTGKELGENNRVEAAGADADSGDETASAKPDPRYKLSIGDYWVRRPGRMSIGSITTSSNKPGQLPETTERGSTVCQPLSVRGPNESNSPKVDFILRDGKWKFVFAAHPSDDGWTLRGPHVERGYFRGSGRCSDELIVEPKEQPNAVLQSSAGPIFTDEQQCREAPGRYLLRCRGDACSYDEPNAQPFVLPECDGALTRLRRRGDYALSTEHSEAMKTLIEFDKRTHRGGKLWQRVGSKKPCTQVTLVPDEHDRVRLESRSPTKDGGHRDKYEVYTFSPLFQRAARFSHGSTCYNSAGEVVGMGASGGGWPTEINLYLTAQAVLLGPRHLYLDRSVCEANQ